MAKANFDPYIPVNKEESIEAIEFILQEAENNKGEINRRIISKATERQIEDLKEEGIKIEQDWVHSIETAAILHAYRRHGNERSERNKGQIAITTEDFRKIPDILDTYDNVTKSETKNRASNEVIKYEKRFEDGTIYYIEEKRDGRKSLAFQTMYKKI